MGNTQSDRKNARCFSLKFSRNTDAEIISHLEDQPSIQAYLKQLIKRDMKKGENTMKYYHINPEYLDQFEGGDPATDAGRILTSTDVSDFAAEWEKPEGALIEMLEQIDADDAEAAAQAILDAGNMNAAVFLMDDDLRETIHAENAPCSDLVFLTIYLIRHQEQFHETFTVN